MRSPIRFANPREARPSEGSRLGGVGVNRGHVIGDDLEWSRRGGLSECGPNVGGRSGFGQQHAVGELPGKRDRFGATHAKHHRRNDLGELGELHVLHTHVPAALRNLEAAQDVAHRRRGLGEQGERGGGPGVEAADPPGHPVADARNHATGKELPKGGELHGGERGEACGSRNDAHPHGDPLRRGKNGASLGDAAAEPQVFHHPDLIEPELLRTARKGQHLADREVARKHDADASLRIGHACQPS